MAKMLLVNPRKRRAPARRRRAPVARRPAIRARRRRNPIAIKGLSGITQRTIIPAATAAAGALGLDVIWGYAPVPANLKVGPLRHVVKGAAAIGLGMLAENFVKKSTAQNITLGALTVVLHDMGREVLQNAMPQIPLGMYMDGTMGYYNPASLANNMGLYLNRPAPAPVAVESEGAEMGAYDPYYM